MYICELLPLKTTKKIDTLSYFTSLQINVGDLVEINMNNQILNAIVLNYKDIRQAKTEIRASDFKIKKITKVLKEKYISGELLEESHKLSTLLGTSINNLFNTMLPISLLESIIFEKRVQKEEGRAKLGLLEDNNQNTHYISPTQKEVKVLEKEKKNNKIKINASTPSLSFLSNQNINKVIITKKNSKHYYSTFKNIDTKKCIEYFCNLLNIEVIYEEELSKNIEIKVTEINEETKLESIYFTKDNFNKIKLYLKENKKIALYTPRLGNSTSIACEDCKSIQKCSTCTKPYTLKKELKQDGEVSNFLFCNMCKTKTELKNILKCSYCKSFRLLPLGIGLGGLEEHVKKIFAENDEGKWGEIKKNIKIINEKDILTLKNIDLLILVSLDSLFSLTEYTIDENIFQTLLSLEKACGPEAEIIIQTRLGKKTFERFLNKERGGAVLDSVEFYKAEVKIRKKNNLPPYSYVLTFESELEMPIPKFLEKYNNYKIKLKTNTEKFVTKLKPVNIKYINRYIYFINKKEWEDDLELREKCFYNLYNFNLKVNPQNILS